MLGFKSFLKKQHSKTPPQVNDIDEISDEFGGQQEAKRQIKNFHHNSFKTEQARDAHYKEHGIRSPRSTDPAEQPREAARYLDHMHHHFPKDAEFFCMKPMFKGSGDEAVHGKFGKHIQTLKQVGTDLAYAVAPKTTEKRFRQKLARGLSSIRQSFNNADGGFTKGKSMADEVHGMHYGMVKQWHRENPDMHHLSAEQVHGSYRDDISKKATMIGPMHLKDFKPHWDKLTRK